jgi:hypothetical protein
MRFSLAAIKRYCGFLQIESNRGTSHAGVREIELTGRSRLRGLLPRRTVEREKYVKNIPVR